MLGGIDDRPPIVGVDMPPEVQFDEEYAGDGSLFLGRKVGPRTVGLPIVIHADNLLDLEGYRRELFTDFAPSRGDGVLSWALPDGSVRTLNCMYETGLDLGDEGRMGGAPFRDFYTVQLRARDPYFYGVERIASFKPPPAASDPFLPGPPFSIAADALGSIRTVAIDGDVETFPDLHMVGPIGTATWVHEDLGVTLELTPNLLAGQELIVRTNPRVPPQQRFTRDGVNVWGEVAGDFPPVLKWVLQPGMNRISTTFAAVGSGADAWLVYRVRYRTA